MLGLGRALAPPGVGDNRFPGTDRALRALTLPFFPQPPKAPCHDSVVLGTPSEISF